MTQEERRRWLIGALLREDAAYTGRAVPADEKEQRRWLRTLFNIRPPRPVSGEFLAIQDAYLREESRKRGVTDADALTPVREGVYLWKGDITTLRCGAIVNAANSGLLGCFVPCHSCIDNCIHTWAGVQLRLACAELMRGQTEGEPVGRARITPAFNLPCRYVLHTVGPTITGPLCRDDREQLASCYRSCLGLARQKRVKSVAFCCISTGEFHFPRDEAAKIAVKTVLSSRAGLADCPQVIFNVFEEADYVLYRNLLEQHL